jgi:hypothetical protein
MSAWDLSVVVAIVAGWLTYRVIQMKRRVDDIARRVDDLETWVLPRKEQEKKEHDRERLRKSIEQGFREGIMAPPEVLREAYPDTYPPNKKKGCGADSPE